MTDVPVNMTNKTYLVRLKAPDLATQHVFAASVEMRGEHLVFVDSAGKLAALFLLEVVSDVSDISPV